MWYSAVMNIVEQYLTRWNATLTSSIPVGGLHLRNPIAYKWKAPFRSVMLREVVFWRITDLMTQSYALHQQEHALGARILLRSGIETLATLIYLNQITQQVLDAKLDFHTFGAKTSKLLLGSRDGTTEHKSINILTLLSKSDKNYRGLEKIYAELSESAHPSFEGLCMGYSTFDRSEYETTFSNRWDELFGEWHLSAMALCMKTFRLEYDDVWIDLIEKLERWIEANDKCLEATKNS